MTPIVINLFDENSCNLLCIPCSEEKIADLVKRNLQLLFPQSKIEIKSSFNNHKISSLELESELFEDVA